ncbi:hypothetical protein ES319_D10G152300v1 [Gossypium barbadense]|uniref:Uncharacterized protein n=3 Tax=Gossypium TaxID=3633 RepID=A0A5J5PTE4_GOSBA|nr:hypothetical protein ES319_D10G152300v1 [Gossypium barbadense]TYG50282.1 hypothetical protein ES288_D10G162200v1 [Gossypium darwinii]TYH49862.1 hypothetical protein ES332_D10G164800v1 [Gossypium tomentosum]
MLEVKYIGYGLKVKPHIDSRLRASKKGDGDKKMVTIEQPIWDAYMKSHKNASTWRMKSFPYFDELTMIYWKDRVTRKYAQATIDILDEINEVEANDEGLYENLGFPKTIDKNFATSIYIKWDKAIGSAKSNKKRKINETCDLVQMVKELGDRFESSLNNLGRNFGTEALVAPKI